MGGIFIDQPLEHLVGNVSFLQVAATNSNRIVANDFEQTAQPQVLFLLVR